jgi:hypothetical protein
MLLTRKIIRERAEPLQKLTDDIHGAAEAGLRVPCLSRHRHLWTSDDKAEMSVAASLCLSCPVLATCGRTQPRTQNLPEFGAEDCH